MFNDDQIVPRIGQTLDYYPTPSERNAAICIQVFESDEVSRPDIAILQLAPNGDLIAHDRIKAADPEQNDPDDTESENNLTNTWGFQHEFFLHQDPTHEETTELGTQTNRHVGTMVQL